jgi:hypothetical protein
LVFEQTTKHYVPEHRTLQNIIQSCGILTYKKTNKEKGYREIDYKIYQKIRKIKIQASKT